MIRAESVVICDDIRQEATNKFLLIGVYTGSVTVAKFPTKFRLCVWIEVKIDQGGEATIQFRIKKNQDKKPIATTKVEVDVVDPSSNLFMALPPVPLRISEQCELVFQMREEPGRWRTIKKMPVISLD